MFQGFWFSEPGVTLASVIINELWWLFCTQQLEDHYVKWYRWGVSSQVLSAMRFKRAGTVSKPCWLGLWQSQGPSLVRPSVVSEDWEACRRFSYYEGFAVQGTVLCVEMPRVPFFFLRNLQFRWRQQTKCNDVYKCCELRPTKGLVMRWGWPTSL